MKISTLPRVFRRRFARIGDKGLTLIELLIVITILSILAAIVFFSARDVRSQATSAATETDAGVIQSAQASYCSSNGNTGYASPMSQLYTPPNNQLTGPPTYNGTVVWNEGLQSGLPAQGSANNAYQAYEAGGAVNSVPTPPPGCGGEQYTIGPLSFQPGNGGPGVIADPEIAQSASFLLPSFSTVFGGINLTNSLTYNSDYLWITTTNVPTLGTGYTDVISRRIATGNLTLMACSAGSASLPVGTLCQQPALDTLNPTAFNNTAAPTLSTVVAEIKLHTAGCGVNPVLAIEDPTSTDPLVSSFGLAASQALINSGLNVTVPAGCIVTAQNLASASTVLHTGGTITGVLTSAGTLTGSAPGTFATLPAVSQASTLVGSAQYALMSQAATTSPVAKDTNSAHDPLLDNGPTNPATYLPITIYANVIDPPSSDGAFTVQAARFVNYLLSPLGVATLSSYGFSLGADSYNSSAQIGYPINESNP